jgi:DNA-binding winged helix-turn-helix (wHTH) protein
MIKGQAKRYYHFGQFRIDVEERILYDTKGAVSLTPKAFDTLLALVENSRRVLSKEELMQKVWPDTFVEENNLAQNISMLRKALEGAGEKLIETVPKRGYRFVAHVSESSEEAQAGPQNDMHAGYTESQHKRRKSCLRDVVIIGRAIDLK